MLKEPEVADDSKVMTDANEYIDKKALEEINSNIPKKWLKFCE